jgi:S-DNA-T family DNA segregation ATPase FtsK/SpoIIIE
MFGSDEPVPMVIEAVVRLVLLVLRSVYRLIRFAIRRPRVASAAVSLVLLDRYLGHAVVVAVMSALLVSLVVWRLAWPDSWRVNVRPRVRRLWLLATYPRKWRRIASRVGLVVHDHTGSDKPWTYGALGDVRVTPAGIVRLRVAIPTGLTLDDYARKADALAVAFGVREARVTASGPGSVWIELHRIDVLTDTIGPLPVTAPPEVDLAGIPVGRHEDGSPWLFSLWQTHVLIAGATGAGKGSVLWSLLRGLSPAINAGWVQVWAIDPKGGMELRPGQRLFSRFEDGTPETMCDLLEDLVAVMDARAKRLAHLGIRKHQQSQDSPHLLAVIDELATLTAFAERDVVRRIDKALGLLLTKGRAAGITVLAAVQDPGKDVVGWRDLFPTRVAMRLDNPIQVDMVLGEGARDVGATADHIDERTPGVAFVRVEGTRAIRRVRASYLTDGDIAELAGSVTASPALTAPRPPKPVDPLDRVDSVPRPVAPDPTPTDGARPRKPRPARKPRNRDGSQVA